MNREKNLIKYGFASILLLASFLMAVPANQYQSVFAQTEGEESEDNQQNVTEAEAENATDVEIPEFENGTAAFVPPPEGDREAPPVPADAIKGADIPDEQPPKDTDSQPLSISNRTELLEILPANSTKIIEHVDEDLKNSTGEGLLPPAIMDKIKSGEGQGNDTILDISTPEELDEIKNFSDVTTNQTTEEALEEGEPISNATNATDTETSSEEQGGEEQEQAQAGAETNMTNATGGQQPAEEREEQKQAEEGEEQAQTAEETQAGEAINMTNATGGQQPAEEREEQKQAEEGEEQEQTQASVEQQQEDTEDGEEQEQAVTNATNATVREGLLNRTNVTSMLNATGLEDQTEDSEDSSEDESEDE